MTTPCRFFSGMGKLIITNKKGETFAVLYDDRDKEFILSHSWCVVRPKRKIYAAMGCRRDDGRKTLKFMHRLLLNPPQNLQIDHINGNGLDNRRSNLRTCNNQQNNLNKGIYVTNKIGYKGVSFQKEKRKWRARIRVDSHEVFLGYFSDPKKAAIAYNDAAVKYFKDFAWTNRL